MILVDMNQITIASVMMHLNMNDNQLDEEMVRHMILNSVRLYRTMFNEKYGEVPVRKAMHKGQYNHPNSIHYGGGAATWSNQTLDLICREHLVRSKRAAMIDIHTGLGPYGYGELMTPSKPGERVFDLFFDWYGDQVHSTTAVE